MTRPDSSPSPQSVIRPSSTSAHPLSTLANRNRSCRHSSCTSSGPDTVSGSGSSKCVSPSSNAIRIGVHTDSDGIHDIVVAVASILITVPFRPDRRPRRCGGPHQGNRAQPGREMQHVP